MSPMEVPVDFNIPPLYDSNAINSQSFYSTYDSNVFMTQM